MEPRTEEKRQHNARAIPKHEKKRKLQIVKLEERIAPRLAANHNETLMSDG